MKYNKWKMKRTIEKAYANAIKKLIQGLQDELKNLDSPFLITSTIKSLARQPTFIKKAEALAKGMITQLFSDNVKSWRQAANKGSQGKMIYKELQKGLTGQIRVTFNELINQNANYISSLPLGIAKYVDRRIAKGVLEGKRATDIRDEILRYYWYNDYSGNMRILDSSICHRSTSRVRYGSSETGSPVKIDGSTRPKR